MAEDRKTLAIMLGAAAGVTVVSVAVLLYMRSHAEQPIKDVQHAISSAYDKLKEIEDIATSKLGDQPA
jgi:hypothetical protein